MPQLGLMELIVILIIVLLLFGVKKLPELARSIGSSAKELRKGLRDDIDNSSVASKGKSAK